MPKSSPAKLAYQAKYNVSPKQKEAQVERRRAQRAAVRDGSSPIGDGRDLSHIVPASSGGHMTKGNVKLQEASKNRDWRKGQKGYRVPVDK